MFKQVRQCECEEQQGQQEYGCEEPFYRGSLAVNVWDGYMESCHGGVVSPAAGFKMKRPASDHLSVAFGDTGQPVDMMDNVCIVGSTKGIDR